MEPLSERAGRYAHAADLGGVAGVLRANREEILGRWLAAASHEPFHAGRPQGAVADHLPRLFDAMVDLLGRSTPRAVDPGAPLEDPALLEAAQSHAQARLEQGLTTADIVQEFRLLRQEIGRALRRHLPAATAPAAPSDLVAAELLVHDSLDGAVFVAISTISAHEAERRARLAASERAREEAEAAVRLRDQVLAALSHDVRTPLTAIQGYAQMLSRHAQRVATYDAALAAALESDAQEIVAATRRLTRWSDEMTDVARLQIGQALPLDRRAVDLVHLVRQVAQELQAQSRGHIVRVNAAVPELVGRWDGPRLERVLHNLVWNAIKYSPEGGDVEVSIDVVPQPRRPAGDAGPDERVTTTAGAACGAGGARGAGSVARHGEQKPAAPAADATGGHTGDSGGAAWAEVRVRDSGIGIPAADLAAVFEPFRRGSNVQGIPGTGIGLVAARHIVEQHGGTLDVASQEGVGTTVTVSLPLAPEPQEER